MTFSDFNFKKEIFKAVNDAGFTEPSPVQKEAIPLVLAGHDLVAQAHTGTGKTAAFGLPVLNMLDLDGSVEALVIVPTRELAMQVSDEIFKFGKNLGINTATVYGGSSYQRQLKFIAKASVVVATPGRLLDLLNSGKIQISPKFMILDEADEMLDMGFLEDIKEIFSLIEGNRQTLMFSATMPHQIKELAKTILYRPEFVSITKRDTTNSKITQNFYVVDEWERTDALIRLLDFTNPVKSIIFCRTRKEVDELSTKLTSKGYSAKGLHGDIEQRQREEIIKSFKRGILDTLVATDVAARGLDVSDVSHVFNYHIPYDSESYVHRIGRTGRAGKEGMAISIVTPAEFKSLQKIQKDVGSSLESKVIPTIKDVQIKKRSSLLQTLKAQKISDLARDLVDELETELVDEDIALKLASIMYSSNDIEGSERIGKTQNEISQIAQRAKNDRGSNRNRGRNNRGGRRRNRDGSNSNRGGSNRNRRNNSNNNRRR